MTKAEKLLKLTEDEQETVEFEKDIKTALGSKIKDIKHDYQTHHNVFTVILKDNKPLDWSDLMKVRDIQHNWGGGAAPIKITADGNNVIVTGLQTPAMVSLLGRS